MDEQIKQRWLEALRSGKYQQTKGKLHDKTGFCCLGVLCDIMQHDTQFRGNWIYGAEGDASFVEEDGVISTALPSEYFMAKVGFNNTNPYTSEVRPFSNGDEGFHQLATLNDGGYTFTQIADIIERDL